MNTLVVLPIAPLSQSRQAKMACGRFYQVSEVYGNGMPGNEFSERGTEIHAALANYIEHLVATKQPTDYAYLDRLIANVGREAAGILEAVRDRMIVDHEHVLETETRLALDEQFLPVPHDNPAAEYAGTIDMVLLHSATRATVVDWKSYYAITDPEDSFQGALYALLIFCHYPEVVEVAFRLEFVRYGVHREKVYSRAGLQDLMQRAKRERARQRELHNPDQERPATPGAHCIYCPLLRIHQCPLGEVNEFQGLTAADRVRWQIYLDQASRANRATLKDWINVEGPVSVDDGNGHIYTAGFKLQERKRFPAIPTFKILVDWITATGEDLTGRMFIGSTELKPLLKAKKRAELAGKLEPIMITKAETRLRFGLDEEEDDDV